MEEMTAEEYHRRMEELPTLHRKFREFPYARLRITSKHGYGVLRVWPKARSWDGGKPRRWSDLAWRPMASYAAHHHRNVLSMTGQFCTAAVRTLKCGWGVESPKEVMNSIHEMNGETAPGAWLSKKEEQSRLPPPEWEKRRLFYGMFDIKDFFVNLGLGEMRSALRRAVRELKKKDPKCQHF